MKKIFISSLILIMTLIVAFYFYKNDACSSITDINNKNICLKKTALENLNPKYCSKISNKDEADVCFITLIGKAMHDKKLDKNICDAMPESQNKNDCISYLFDKTGDMNLCLGLKTKQQQEFCLGPIKIIFDGNIKVENTDICDALKEHGYQQRHDQCRYYYVKSKQSYNNKICYKIKNHLAFYNCIKTVALNQNNADICSDINMRLPYPNNYPVFVFSESGCRHWVNHGGSYQGLKDPNKK